MFMVRGTVPEMLLACYLHPPSPFSSRPRHCILLYKLYLMCRVLNGSVFCSIKVDRDLVAPCNRVMNGPVAELDPAAQERVAYWLRAFQM